MTTALGVAALLAFWLALWGEASVGNVLTGLLVVGLLSVLFREPVRDGVRRVRPWSLLRLLLAMVPALIGSSLAIARTSLRPAPDRLRAAIVAVRLRNRDDVVAMMMAQLVGVTPGTIVVGFNDDEDGRTMFVHGLGIRDADALRRQVLRLETRVQAAFGPVSQGRREEVT